MGEDIFIGGGGADYGTAQHLLLNYANRHGLVAGATGTGKTVTLQIIAQALSEQGVPVFLSDVKGDLSGLAKAGSPEHKLHDAFMKRAGIIGLDLNYAAAPVRFWDIFGQQGLRVRTTIADMGPLLLARLLDASEAQEGVLNIAFRVADEQGWPLLDLDDLRALLIWVGENRADLALRYGTISPASIGAIQRQLLVLEAEGAQDFFGEPALDIDHLMSTDASGAGIINILAADKLMQSPRLYATFLLWLLSELFEALPEVGDPDKPKLVFFFDEAHLLFDDAPDALVDKVEQVARLIRSKGVGVFFISQHPADIPEDILGQLGNRIQHALRAFTANDRRKLREAAQTYRDNPTFDTEEAIREVGTGEAVTSMLDEDGAPGVVERTLIRPPSSQLGPITESERAALLSADPLTAHYAKTIDRESASEILAARAAQAAEDAAKAEAEAARGDMKLRDFNAGRRYTGRKVSRSTATPRAPKMDNKMVEAVGGILTRQIGKSMGIRMTATDSKAIVRGVLGGLFRGR